MDAASNITDAAQAVEAANSGSRLVLRAARSAPSQTRRT
jgi:hypothetical protein